jgi:hypothetical protein
MFKMVQSIKPWTGSLLLALVSLSFLSLIHAEVDYVSISPIQLASPLLSYSQSLQTTRREPDFGGRRGLVNASNLSKHKNRIKTIGVQFFAEDSLSFFNQDQIWEETYHYDESSVGYHWFGKSHSGLGTMNMIVRDVQTFNNQTATVIVG